MKIKDYLFNPYKRLREADRMITTLKQINQVITDENEDFKKQLERAAYKPVPHLELSKAQRKKTKKQK